MDSTTHCFEESISAAVMLVYVLKTAATEM